MEPLQEQNSEKIQLFIKEYGELVEKHGVDFANYPMFVPDKDRGFRVIVQTVPVEMKEQPQKSPFIA